jgi:hypothetical protein
MFHTSDALNDLLPDTPWSVLELKGQFAQIPEISATFDNQHISVILFSAKNALFKIIVIPRGYTFRGVIKMVVSTKDDINPV